MLSSSRFRSFKIFFCDFDFFLSLLRSSLLQFASSVLGSPYQRREATTTTKIKSKNKIAITTEKHAFAYICRQKLKLRLFRSVHGIIFFCCCSSSFNIKLDCGMHADFSMNIWINRNLCIFQVGLWASVCVCAFLHSYAENHTIFFIFFVSYQAINIFLLRSRCAFMKTFVICSSLNMAFCLSFPFFVYDFLFLFFYTHKNWWWIYGFFRS